MALLTQRTLALSADTDDLIHIVKTDDFSQSPFGSSYKATLGQVLALVPSSSGYTQVQDEGVDITQSDTLNFVGSGVTVTDVAGVTTVDIPGGALGGLVAIKNLNPSGSGFIFGSNPGVRAFNSTNIGNDFNGYTFVTNWGSINSATTFNISTGIFTVPYTGWYDLSFLFSVSISNGNSNQSNQLTSAENPDGFVGSGGATTSVIPAGGADLSDYFGKFIVAIIRTDGQVIVCSNSYSVDYNTSQVIISASYTNRPLTANQTYHIRWLYTCKNNFEASQGNSIHFTITHLR